MRRASARLQRWDDGTVIGFAYAFNDLAAQRALGAVSVVGVASGCVTRAAWLWGGQRVQKVDSWGTTRYVYDGATVLGEVNASGSFLVFYGPGLGRTDVVGGSLVTNYTHQDALGSTTAVTDASGNRTGWYWYQAFGSSTTYRQQYWTPFKFAGKSGYYADFDSGMELLGRRYYLPDLHRFLTQDPQGHAAGLNLYEYANNNPLSNVDPTGLDDDPVDQGIRNGFTTGGAMIGMFVGGGTGGAAGSGIPGAGTAVGVGIGAALGGLEGTIDGRLAGEVAVGLRHLGNYLFDSISGGGGGNGNSYGGGSSGVSFVPRSLQHTYSNHAGDFGFTQNWNSAVARQFEAFIRRFLDAPTTRMIQGTYRNTMPVVHHFDPATGLNVMIRDNGSFLGGWKLSPQQIGNLLRNGNVR